MFLKIKKLLAPAEITRLTELAAELQFVEGRLSNPANLTKDNLQADPRDAKYTESVQLLHAALVRSREFLDFTMPKRIAPPLLCRYEPGMKYGAHADAAIIQLAGTRLRSDLSCTIFVADPASYEGGELGEARNLGGREQLLDLQEHGEGLASGPIRRAPTESCR